MRSILLHLHPARVSEKSIQFNRTFGLGGMAVLLIVIQIFTGVLLRFYYTPVPAEAYNSIVFLKTQVLFGQFIRNIHYWSGVFLLLTAFLHFLRVFLTGAYRDERRLNWLFGLILLLLVVFLNFTGYLLPWDQLAYWAITVSTNIIGYLPVFGESLRKTIIAGNELNADTLRMFFTFHTAVLPFSLLFVVIYHFWRVRKAGGVLIPESSEKPVMVPVMPNLVYKEFIVALVLVAVLFTFSALFNAPLLEKANPAYSMNPTKAPWYFAGVQELLMHFHPFFAAFIIPLSVFVFLAWIPFLNYAEASNGHWFISEKGEDSSKNTAIFKNTVRFNVTNPLIFGDGAWILGYERTIGEHQSFSVNIGRASFPEFSFINYDSADINLKKDFKDKGFNFSADYRFYPVKENKYRAPRGVYFGPFYSYNYFNRINQWTLNTNTFQGNVETDLSLNMHTVGIELGYQFVFWKRLSVDLILIGPGVSFYNIKAEFNTTLSADDESLFFDKLNELLKDKLPGYDQVITGSGFKETGTMRSTTFGFRYMIMVGFRF